MINRILAIDLFILFKLLQIKIMEVYSQLLENRLLDNMNVTRLYLIKMIKHLPLLKLFSYLNDAKEKIQYLV